MSAYESLSACYDALTEDVDYASLADRYEANVTNNGKQPELILDLACGTGTLTHILSTRGYQMIGVDGSAEMLAQAAEKTGDILYLHQSLTELDLYGTVDAAICTLDSLNYLPPEELETALGRVALFLVPGGTFAFDLHTPEKLRGLDGELFCDERENLVCLWRCSFDEAERACYYDFDLFEQAGSLWRRNSETHVQYAYERAEIREKLEQAGFQDIRHQICEDRIFITATRPLKGEI